MDAAVSVVIPVRNEERTIGRLLDSLLNQTRAAAEIIVVDADSEDRTAQIVSEYEQAAIPVRLIRSRLVFPGTGRNLGVQHAASEYVAFTDAGITLDACWLERLTFPLNQDPSVDVVFGSYHPVTSTFFTQCAATAYVPAKSNEQSGNFRGPSIASCLLRTCVFQAIDGFRPYRAAEDLIFIEELIQGGYNVTYAPAAIAHWELASGWLATYRRFTLYSYHNLVADRGRHWHYGVARFYILAFPFFLLSCLQSPLWLVVPASGFLARTFNAIWRKHNESWGGSFNPLRWVTVGFILLLLDAATLSGAIWWGLNKLLGRLPMPLRVDEEKLS